jgi:outer membrane protein
MKKTTMAKTVAASLLLAASAANADIHVNFGAINVSPDESSNALNAVETVTGSAANSLFLGLDSNTQLGITIDYDYTDNIVFELVAATPFTHEIAVKSSGALDGLAVGETKHLPPTLLAQYHFGTPADKFRPFVGAGVNYTVFFDEKVDSLDSALTGLSLIGESDELSLDLDASVGLALQVGANYELTEKWGIHAMAMWADISAEGDVKLNGSNLQKVDIDVDPLVLMIGARYTF